MSERRRMTRLWRRLPRTVSVGLTIWIIGMAGGPLAFGQDVPGPAPSAGATATTGGELATPGGSLEGPIDPKRYTLGPGDLINVRISLRPPIDRTLRLSPEGFLILPEGPSVPLADVSLAAAETTVTQVLARYYREPVVKLQLLELRTFSVFGVGEVHRPGVVQATAVARASELFSRVGGLLPDASRRAIRIDRAGGEFLRVDLGLFETTGDLSHNPVVEAGDRIYVPPVGGGVTISGAVRRPDWFEVVPGDSAATLLALAHGLRVDAIPDSAYLESFKGSPTRSWRRILDLRKPEDRRVAIHERDLLFVRPQPDWRETRSVLIEGEVRYPGVHAIPGDSLPLTRMIGLAGGFTGLVSLREAHVLRRKTDLPTDPEFERLSKLPTAEMTQDEYEYYSLKLKTQQPVVSVDFEALFLRGDLSHDIHVRPGDEIRIPRIQPYVTVVGEVARPGNIPFGAELDVDRYIERAGGFTWRASRGKVSVIRALTGEWVRKGKARELGPGDTIWIPRKGKRDYWKTILDSVSVIAQLATIYLVIDNAVAN